MSDDLRKLSYDFIGDSHVARLLDSSVNFPMRGGLLHFWQRRGGGLDFVRKVVDDIEWDLLVRDPVVADVTVLFIGGNDLDKADCHPIFLARAYAELVRSLDRWGSKVVVMGNGLGLEPGLGDRSSPGGLLLLSVSWRD